MVDFLISLRGTLLEAHSVHALADIKSVSESLPCWGKDAILFLNIPLFVRVLLGPDWKRRVLWIHGRVCSRPAGHWLLC